jgi:retron-type reverse transcriptase
MKRHDNLWPKLTSFAHLFRAAHKASRGKLSRPDVARFHLDLERELVLLRQELTDRTWQPGAYRTFTIREPKPRLISAAPYRDRVVHHALVGVLEPIFERSFLFDSYACRTGKGTHAAVRRCQHFARRHAYAWKADIRKFFPSLDHVILESRLAQKIKDQGVLWLAGRIIAASNPQEPVQAWFPGDDLFTPSQRRRGLPIGNQTSQFFANVYLDPLDHFVKDRLRASGYVRYVDDFVAFADDRRELARLREQVAEFLAGLRLLLHPTKNAIFPTRQGIRFLGYRVNRSHVELVPENVWRFRRRLRRLQRLYAQHQIDASFARRRIAAWIGHAQQADTQFLRERLFAEHPFRRAAVQ